MKLGGIALEKEPAGFLLRKLGEPHIMSHINHMVRQNSNNRRARRTITQIIHIMNFSAGNQRINNNGSNREAETIFEVKIFTVCKSRHTHDNTIIVPVVDSRARMVVSSYSRKFETLYSFYLKWTQRKMREMALRDHLR